MATDRIQIINEDLGVSTSTPELAIKGFTVVKASKGPIEPIYFKPGSSSDIYEKIGYPSAEHATIQEAIDFNNAGYGIYISAPYDTAAENRLPAAYVTPAGVLTRATPVDVSGVVVERIVSEEEAVTGINVFSATESVLVPLGREATYFNEGADVSEVIEYVAGDVKQLVFNIGFDISPVNGALSAQTTTNLHFLNTSAFNTEEPGRVLRNDSASDAILVVDIPGAEATIELHIDIATGNTLLVKDNAGRAVGEVLADASGNIYKITLDSEYTRGEGVTGLYKTYFSASAIATTWASPAFRAGVKVYWKAALNSEAIYATIFPKYLSQRSTTLTFPRQQLGNKLGFTAREEATPGIYASYSIEGSLEYGTTDGFGAALDFESRLANQGLLNVAVIKPFAANTIFTATNTSTGPTITMESVILSRGVRVVTDSSLEHGWEAAQAPEMDSVEVFFNPVPLTAAETLFTSLANTHSLSRFIGSRMVAPSAATEDLPQLSYGSNYYITTNMFSRKSSFTRESFMSPLTGAYAAMIAKIIDRKAGGAAPMYLNGAGGVGGQLEGISVGKVLYKYKEAELTYLDEACYNPIVKDPAYGVMVVSQRTAKAGEKSDWSYIGHSSAFLRFQRQMRDTVMYPQLGKANNPYYQDLRAEQTKDLLKARTDGPGRIWAAGTVDTVTVNTDEVKRMRWFKIAVRVKVDTFSEGVTLTFTNVDQATQIG